MLYYKKDNMSNFTKGIIITVVEAMNNRERNNEKRIIRQRNRRKV